MKQRNLKAFISSPMPLSSIFGHVYFWFEADEHGSDIVWRLHDGRVYRSSGILETPVREDLRRPL